jgi:hypothetical protein
MISSLYGKYFQKSRSFLFPALGIKKSSSFTPSGVYLSIEGKLTVEDKKLICAYKAEDTDVFKTFERDVLLSNPLFECVVNADEFKLYIFNFEKYKEDWELFLKGKYSKLSKQLKKLIKDYYGETSSEYKYMETYLYPERFVDVYAKLLNVEMSLLKEVGELCDLYNPEKENLSIESKEVDLQK